MQPLTGVMIYVLIWWMVMFCILPFNIQTENKPTDGAMPGAPLNPHLKGKIIITTAISSLVWVIVYCIIQANLVSFHDIAAQMSM